MAEWRANGPVIYLGADPVAHAHDSAIALAEENAAFLVAAAEHYRIFLGETTNMDSDIEPYFYEFFSEKTQKGS